MQVSESTRAESPVSTQRDAPPVAVALTDLFAAFADGGDSTAGTDRFGVGPAGNVDSTAAVGNMFNRKATDGNFLVDVRSPKLP